MDTLPSLLVTVLSWTYSLIPRLGQDALRTVHLLPYLLHALPSLSLYHLRVHQYLLMCTLCAPFVPTSPHCHLRYHCTFCARYLALLNRNHMCRIAVHSGHWLIVAALVERRNPLKGSSMIYTHLR